MIGEALQFLFVRFAVLALFAAILGGAAMA
jgi:hypothetical protein